MDDRNPEAKPRTLDHDQQARVINEFAVAATLDNVLTVGNGVEPVGVKKYLDNFTADAGNPKDPIERLMVEQIVFAHHRIAGLHAQSSTATDMRAVQIYGDLALRLLAEFRRLAMSLHEYRTPVQGRTTTVIHKVEQLNQAQGDQAVSFKTTPQGGSQMIARDGELVSSVSPQAPRACRRCRRSRPTPRSAATSAPRSSADICSGSVGSKQAISALHYGG